MRILIIAEVYLPKVDGVVRRTMNLIRELLSEGDEILVVCPTQDEVAQSPVPVVGFPGFSFLLYPEYCIGRPDDRLTKVVADFQPDVVHFINPFAFGFQCYDLLQHSGTNFASVFSFHTLYAEFVKRYPVLRPLSSVLWWLTRHYHNHSDVNLTVSTVALEDLRRRGFRNVDLWRPAVDSDLFHPRSACSEMRRRLSGDFPDRKLLLTASRLAPEKDIEFLAEVLRQVPEAMLAIVGDGPHRAALERHFRGLPVHFTGYLHGEELAAAYASADAFVYASRTETMGNVVLEAMACAAPLVAPAAGGISGLVDHGVNGLLYSPGNITEAAEFVRTLLEDQEQRQRISEAAREYASGCSWSEAARGVRRAYERAIERHRALVSDLPRSTLPARLVTRLLVNSFALMSSLKRPAKSTSTLTAASTAEPASVSAPVLLPNTGISEPTFPAELSPESVGALT